MPTNEEILDKLADIVHETTGRDKADVQLDKSFTDDLNVDSLEMTDIVFDVEDAFNVELPEDQTKDLKTVGDAVSLIQKALG